MEKAKCIFEKVQRIVNGIIGLMLIAIMVIIFVQTFTRYVIFYSIPWSEEASRYLFVGMILLGINMGISQNLMVRIDLIDNFLSAKNEKKTGNRKANSGASYILRILLQYIWNDPHWRVSNESCTSSSDEYHVWNFMCRFFTGSYISGI